MPLNLTIFKKSLKKAFSQIESSQAEALSQEISINYIAGRTAGEKHQSTIPVQTLPAKSIPAKQLPAVKSAEDQEEDGLTDEEKAELAILLALFLGNIKKFNTTAQTQILTKVKEMSEAGSSKEEIQKYVQDVFEGKENIVIDNGGKKKKELYVDKDLKISERSKTISKPFYASVLTYSTLLAEIASHRAYEEGRKQAYIKNHSQWVFVGPADEIARPHHVCLLGQVFTWNTLQSNYAEKVLQEPRCRHRAEIYKGDGTDTDAKEWQRLKDSVGLYWDQDSQKWDIKV